MKKSKKTERFTILAGLLLLFAFSCTDTNWNDYYDKPDYLEEGTVAAFLAEKPDYSEFAGLLKKTGYDSLLVKGGSYTVFAVKNGAFSGIDATTDIVVLKKIMGMHVLPVHVFKEKMNSNHYLSLAGKQLRFSSEGGTSKVNNVSITDAGTRVQNGLVYSVEKVIMPLPTIAELLLAGTDSAYSIYQNYIKLSIDTIIDPDKNIRIGYDTLNNPVYKPPFIYKITNSYLASNKLDDDNQLSTVFAPSETAKAGLNSKLLSLRDGKADFMLPTISYLHGDTTIGGYFLRRNYPMIGDYDKAINYLTTKNIVNKEVIPWASGTQNLKNISGETFSVNQSDIVVNSTKYASNGYIYTLNKFSLPDLLLRRSYSMLVSPTMLNNANVRIINPDYKNITYRNGFTYTATNLPAVSDYITTFYFNMIGAEMDITFPYITKGNYSLSIGLKMIQGATTANMQGFFDVIYNSVKLTQFQVWAFQAGNNDFTMFLANITVNTSGPVKITFRLADMGTRVNTALMMSQLNLDPIE